MKKTLTLLFVLIATLNGYTQFSKTHYIPPITSANSIKPGSGAASSTDPDINQYIYISTPSTTPVTVTINPIGGTPVTQTLTNANPWVYTITTSPSILNDPSGNPAVATRGFDNQLLVDYSKTNTVLNDKGFLIEASDLVYVNLRVQSRVSGNPAKSSQAGGLVSKGLNAFGKDFRIGGFENKTALSNSNYGSLVNFASFVATEDNTTVTIDLPRGVSGVTTFHNGAKYNGSFTVNLNKNESYVFAVPNTSSSSFDSNIMLGGHITSDRNIVVNSGSIAGNSQIQGEGIANSLAFNTAGKDYGFDQIVPSEKTGKEYIFVGGAGMIQITKAYDLERVIIIANVNNTQVFKNGEPTPFKTLQAGEYCVFNGNDFTGSAATGYNLYVTTSENVFAYQCIAGNADGANQNMFFVPPLNCATPSVVNNIPLIERVGIVSYTNTVINITTEAGPSDPTPTITTSNLGAVQLTGANCLRSPVTGKPGFVTYTYPKPGDTSITGNISVSAPKQVYVSYYGTNGNATYGGYFSGFDARPDFSGVSPDSVICLSSGVALSVTSAVPTDLFQWQFSATKDEISVGISGATGNTYTPKSISAGGKGPGYYGVTKISACSNIMSRLIAISECPIDIDNDGVNNNVDVDNDNDGITNATESYGDVVLDLSNLIGGTLTAGNGAYTNSYTAAITPVGIGNTFLGTATGDFTTSLAAGSTNSNTYSLNNFTKPMSLELKYNPNGTTFISQSNAAFEVKSDLNSTITILNPSNQLLIDTDYDGIYESGVTQFTSFDIRFVLNPSVLIADGINSKRSSATTSPVIDFKIQTYMANSISFTHINKSDNLSNTASFSLIALSVPRDTDGDGKSDQEDVDSDGDTFSDVVEAGFTDSNSDGILGSSPVTVDVNGKVTSGIDGYTTPNAKYLIKDALGVEDFDANSKFILYPNPTTGVLNIESNIADNFTIINQLGQVVKTVKVNVGTNKVNLENLVDGVYFLKNQSGENQVVKKIIKN